MLVVQLFSCSPCCCSGDVRHVYLAVWDLLVPRLAEADGGQTREVEAGRPSQQRGSKQPPQHPHPASLHSGITQLTCFAVYNASDIHTGPPPASGSAAGRHVTFRKSCFVKQSIVGSGILTNHETFRHSARLLQQYS